MTKPGFGYDLWLNISLTSEIYWKTCIRPRPIAFAPNPRRPDRSSCPPAEPCASRAVANLSLSSTPRSSCCPGGRPRARRLPRVL